MSSRRKIKPLEKRRAFLLLDLMSTDKMIAGSFSQIYRKCGKQNCWCTEGDGHPLTRLTWKDGNLSKTRSIPKEDIKRVRQLTDNYRRFRKGRRALKVIETNIKKALEQLENTLTIKYEDKK